MKAYLLGREWAVKPSANANYLRFEGPSQGKGEPLFQLVPASDHFSDFAHSMACLITTLSEFEDRHPIAVLDDILQAQQDEAGNGEATVAKPRRQGAG